MTHTPHPSNPFHPTWAARKLAEGIQPCDPVRRFEERLAGIREGFTGDGPPLDDNPTPQQGEDGSSGGEHVQQVGDLVRSIVVSPSLDVAAKLAKIKSALKLLDDSGPSKPADSPGDGADAVEDDEVN